MRTIVSVPLALAVSSWFAVTAHARATFVIEKSNGNLHTIDDSGVMHDNEGTGFTGALQIGSNFVIDGTGQLFGVASNGTLRLQGHGFTGKLLVGYNFVIETQSGALHTIDNDGVLHLNQGKQFTGTYVLGAGVIVNSEGGQVHTVDDNGVLHVNAGHDFTGPVAVGR
jgi:hypothetical protein